MRTPLHNALLQNDLDAAGYKIINLDADNLHEVAPDTFDADNDYAMVADTRRLTNVVTTSGTKIVTSAGAGFTSDDVGKSVVLYGRAGTSLTTRSRRLSSSIRRRR
jgi:hypothetical protein